MKTIEQMRVDEISSEQDGFSVSRPERSVDANGLHATLEEMADSFDVTGFKCVKCNLVHKHDTTKHRLTSTFDVNADTVAQMDFSSVCHCGVNEAARRGSMFGIDESEAARHAAKAPIPPETSRQMDEEFGSY